MTTPVNRGQRPGIGRRGHTQQYGDFVLTGDSVGFDGEEPFFYYACVHEDGWSEAVTVNTIANSDDLELPTTLDKAIVEYIEDTLEWYEDVGILPPPFHTYLTLLNGAEYTMFVPRRIWGPDHLREIGTDEFLFGELVIDRYDADVPTLLRKPLYRLWNRTGWSLSLNYNEIEEDGETRSQWDPPGLTNSLSTICKCPHF